MPTFRIPDMTCEQCLKAVTAAVHRVDAHAVIAADLDAHSVEIGSIATPAALATAITEAGFTPVMSS